MLKYQRLANSQYAYTETTQLVGDIDFTNPNRSFITGYLKLGLTTGGPYDKVMIFGTGFASSLAMSSARNFAFSTSGTVTSSYTWPEMRSRTINGITYYGLLASQAKIYSVIGDQPSNSGSDYEMYFAPYKITITYIESASNTIKTVILSSETELSKKITKASAYTDKSTYIAYVTGGLGTDDIVLNVKFEDYPVETQSNNENDSNSNISDSDDSEIVAPVPGPIVDGGSTN